MKKLEKISIIIGIVVGLGSLFSIFTEFAPKPSGTVDESYDAVDESFMPGKILIRFPYSGVDTDKMLILQINHKTKIFRDIPCEEYVPRDDLVSPYDTLLFNGLMGEGAANSNFATFKGNSELNLIYSSMDEIIFDYRMVDRLGNELLQGKEFWYGPQIFWEELDNPGKINVAWFGANTVKNPMQC